MLLNLAHGGEHIPSRGLLVHPTPEYPHTLDRAGRLALASQLGERPETTLTLHALRTDDAVTLAIGSAPRFEAALVAWTEIAHWPYGYGDPELIARLAAEFGGWGAVCVSNEAADAVAAALEEHQITTDRQTEVFYRLDPNALSDPPDSGPARALAPIDAELLDSTAEELGVREPEKLLAQSSPAGVVIDGRVVALAYNGASSARYGDVAVATLEQYRRRGLAHACARLVSRLVIEAGRTPVWCTGEDNIASRLTARAVGFSEVQRRVNLHAASAPTTTGER